MEEDVLFTERTQRELLTTQNDSWDLNSRIYFALFLFLSKAMGLFRVMDLSESSPKYQDLLKKINVIYYANFQM